MSNWVIGKTYGGFKFVSATETEATFEAPDGSTVVQPNIFQEKSPARRKALGINSGGTEGTEPKVRKTHTLHKNPSEESLLEELAKVQARIAKLSSLKK